MGPKSNDQCPYKRKKKESWDPETQWPKGEGPEGTTEAKIEVMQPQA